MMLSIHQYRGLHCKWWQLAGRTTHQLVLFLCPKKNVDLYKEMFSAIVPNEQKFNKCLAQVGMSTNDHNNSIYL